MPANPKTVKAKPYSKSPCNDDKIYAPNTTCNAPHNNQDKKPTFIPQRNATINTGIIANDIDPPFGHTLNFKNGSISSNIARAVKMATSIKNNVRFELTSSPLPFCYE